MPSPIVAGLLSRYPIISDQIGRPALQVVLGRLEDVLDKNNVAGDIVEFGCYIGTTSLFIRRLLDTRGQPDERAFHVYDSFEGLPPKASQDESAAGVDFQAGALSVSRKQLLAEFRRARLQLPIVHKGWFGQLAPQDVPPHLAFAFLDGDFYGSILDSLKLVWPRLSPGGIITIDDYRRETLPGVERAVHDYFQSNAPRLHVAYNIGVIAKP